MTILIAKFGTEVLMHNGALDQGLFMRAARQIVRLQKQGVKTVIVSSGAIQAGKERIAELSGGVNAFSSKGLAGIGSRLLLNRWSDAFASYTDTDVAQFWLTYQNWQDAGERESIKSELLALLKTLVVPVVNENDVVSDEELRKYELGIGENDQLARMIAKLVGAQGILFLTSTGGVYEADPALNPNAKMLSVVDSTMLDDLSLFGNSSKGTGGMRTKVREALRCAKSGMRAAIAGLTEDSILRFGKGESVGTTVK